MYPTNNLPYEKVGKNEPVCIADEVPFDIPNTWEWVRFSSVISLQSGQDMTPDCYNDLGIGIPYLTGASNIINGNVLINRWTDCGKAFAYKGNLLITCKGTIGAMAILKEDIVHIARQIMAITPSDALLVSYAQLVLETLVTSLKSAAKSMIPGISRDDVLSSLLPLPPLNEQQRIVDKFQSLIPMLEQYNASEIKLSNLNTGFPDLLKKSILQEAVQGKLVPQDPNDEPASVLLERIRAEKQKLIAEGKIKKDKHESVIFRRDNSHYEKRGSKEENIDDIIPFELPDSWEWIRLSAILTSTDAGKSPQCENRPRTIGEWGVIKTTAIQDGYFLAEENKVLPPDFNLQESMVVHHGDLLITRAGPRNRTGVICVVDGEPENLILSDKTVRLSYLRNFVNPHYVMTALSSPAMQYFVVDAMTGMAASQVNISQEKMKTFLLPLPPLNEQQRIVDEVSKIFGRIDKLNF